jgi:uncharacterized membrane protein
MVLRRIYLSLVLLFAPAIAAAELKLCNDHSETVYAAIAFNNGENWLSQGWWTLEAGECDVAISEPLKNKYYYYFAQTQDRVLTSGQYAFCVENEVFDILGGHDSCAFIGYLSEQFEEIDIGDASSHRISISSSRASSSLGDISDLSAVRARLQGSWWSEKLNSAGGSEVFFVESHRLRVAFVEADGSVDHYYDGSYYLDRTCNGQFRDTGAFFIVTEKEHDPCWRVLELSESLLVYRDLARLANTRLIPSEQQ